METSRQNRRYQAQFAGWLVGLGRHASIVYRKILGLMESALAGLILAAQHST